VAVNPFRGLADFLAKMGLTVRDDPRRVIDISARQWGETLDGFALSLEPFPGGISVVLLNVGEAPRTLTIPAWLRFFRFDIDAPLTPFGRQLLSPERQAGHIAVTLKPREPVETQVPLGSLFALRPGEKYAVQASCTLPDGDTLHSNRIVYLCV
jgi:hypothetical protein